jgi:hypothetical protein
MKAPSLFYFIGVICVLFSSCKKESIEPATIVGKWYVERYTTYKRSYNYGEKIATANYESIGIFNFYENGTGDYFFDNQTVKFTYSFSENTNSNSSNSSFNGIAINPMLVNNSIVNILFDKATIHSVASPIINDFYSLDITRYQVFIKTKNTLRFTSDFYSSNVYQSSNSDFQMDFVMTRQ